METVYQTNQDRDVQSRDVSPPMAGEAIAAYIHIPFCRRRCYYCDFPVSIVGDRPPLSRHLDQDRTAQGFGVIAEYLTVLLQEIRQTSPQGRSLQTVYFGGGTPSLLDAAQLATLLQALDEQFGIAADAEISIEVDPDTCDRHKLQAYQSAGINRVSLGVQAFQPELLQACGRTHTPADIDRAAADLHELGLTNFSLDLISGLPHQTSDHWQDSLEKAIALRPTHLSIYDLIVEPQTAFSRWYRPGETPLPSDEAAAEFYRIAQRTLVAAGFEHYEISNYGRSGYHCRHNQAYWHNQPYYGFGMGAASYLHGRRYTRPRTRQTYRDWVNQGGLTRETSALEAGQAEQQKEMFLDTVMVGLRLAEGLNLDRMTAQFGQTYVQKLVKVLSRYGDAGWVIWKAGRSLPSGSILPSSVYLSDPEGFLFSNVVLAEVFHAFLEHP